MKAKVLIVEDVKELADLVSLYLAKEGLEVRAVESAEDALAELSRWQPDLIILDINLPGMDGFEFLNRYRKTGTAPVLIVSARDADEDIIAGLGSGADGFVTKPFSPRVLVARVRAMLRRAQEEGGRETDRIISFGSYALDLDSCILKRAAERIQLSAKEFGVLAFLAEHIGKPQTPDAVYAAVWKNAFGDLTAVAVYIQRLRKKIELDPGAPQFIETVHGMGYRLNSSATEDVL
ncbi:MAG: response regulator transcription factor [Treponemataceae bacterium]